MRRTFPVIITLSISLAACGQPSAPEASTNTQGFAEIFAPDAPVIDSKDLTSQSVDKDAKVLRTHTFSNGESFNYTTYNDLVISGDMVLGSVDNLNKDIEKYESSLKNLKGQGAMANACTSRFLGFLWCNGFYGRKWDYNVVYLEPYSASLTDADKNAINAAINHISANTNVRFSFANSTDRIYFTNTATDGCWSRLGRQGGRQQLNLGNGCKTMGIAAHELLHAIGMVHEHQRADRDTYITINTNNLTSKGLDNVASRHDATDMAEMSAFDYGSIMMYPQYTTDASFVYNTSQPMFYLTRSSSVTPGQRSGLSALDIQTINTRYR